MSVRIAAGLILVSQLLLVWVGLPPSAPSALWFTFAGTPCLAVGSVMSRRALRRRR